MKKPPRKKSTKKPETPENKEKESLVKDGSETKRKSKTKQNMIVQPMLKNVDAQIFQNVAAESKIQEQKEPTAEPRVEDFMVMENRVLEDLMSLGCETYNPASDSGLGLETAKPERTDGELENSETKDKGVVNKMPGRSLLNQDLLSKNALVQSNSLRVLKAKQTKSGVLNVLSAGERLQPSEGQPVVGHILKSDNRSQEIVTSAGKKIIIQTSFAGMLFSKIIYRGEQIFHVTSCC